MEDRGVGADSEGERDHGDGGESGAAQEDAGAIPEILSEILDDADAPGVAALLFALLDAVHRPERREPRLGGGEAFRDVLVGQPLDVKPELVVELPLDGVAPEQGADAERYGVEPAFKSHRGSVLLLMGSGGRTTARYRGQTPVVALHTVRTGYSSGAHEPDWGQTPSPSAALQTVRTAYTTGAAYGPGVRTPGAPLSVLMADSAITQLASGAAYKYPGSDPRRSITS